MTDGAVLTRARSAPVWWILAAVPAAAMLYAAATAPTMNFKDYWQVLVQVTSPDGSLHPRGLATLYVGHPVELFGTLCWLDAKLFGGDNRALAVLAVLLGGVIVYCLNRMLPARLSTTQRGSLTVAFSFLMFNSTALEIFVLGGSGVHWLCGLTPATVAILLAHRGRAMPAVGVALLASLGHGSAFPVWVALVVIGWLRRDRPWRLGVTAGAGVVVIVTWLLLPKKPVPIPTDTPLGPDSFLAATVGTLSPIRDTGAAATSIAVGALVAALLLVLIVRLVQQRLAPAGTAPVADVLEAAGWVGLGVQLLLVAVVIGGLRDEFGATIGITSRYAMLPGLAGCALLALLALRFPQLTGARTAALALCVSLVTYAGGTLRADEVRAQFPVLQLSAVAMRVGDRAEVAATGITPDAVHRAAVLHVYPFTSGFTVGCGFHLGDHVDQRTIRRLPGQPLTGNPTVGLLEKTPTPPAELFSGWAMVDNRRADCVLVVDEHGVVVGGGAVGEIRADVAEVTGGVDIHTGWTATAERGTVGDTVVLSSDDVLYRVTVPS
ncbi:MAG TPA: hypothetical protein VGG05_18720 [Pseudonocardiaceae bacterium]|jgi:hypothetical protein